MKPMLAHIFEPKRWTSGPAWVQPKFDGIRALYQAGHFQSRDELPFPPGLLAHLSEPLKELFLDERIILDGELYVHGWPLQRINAAVTPVRQHPTDDTIKVGYYVFDVVDFNKSFSERFTPIANRIHDLGNPKNIWAATTTMYTDPLKVDHFYALMVSEGFEGVMYRLGDCPYTVPKELNSYRPGRTSSTTSKFLSDKNNRTWHLLKRKDWRDDEFTCIDYNLTIGEKGEEGFQMTCKTKQGVRFNIGSGLTAHDRKEYFKNPPLGRPIKVKFRCYTRDGVPFNPTVIAVL